MGRYSISHNSESDPNAFPALGRPSLHSRAQNAVISETHLFGPHWINNTRVSYYRSIFLFGAIMEGTNVNEQAGIKGFAGLSSIVKVAPHTGSVVSMELSRQNSDRTLPAFVALNTGVGAGPGYFPPDNAPFYISPSGGGLANTSHRDGAARFDTRYGLLEDLDREARSSVETPASDIASFSRAGRRLVYNSDIDRVFTFDQNEKNRYGNSSFGNACIAARNLLRTHLGARFIQITQGNWDQHSDIYAPSNSHMTLAKVFDSGLATLIADLKNDGSLNDTLIVALGEFGRVPGALNAQQGRDHFLQQSVLFAGGGVQGGRILGATDKEGKFTADPGWSRQRDIKPEDIEATIYSALGIDWTTVRRDDPLGRGFEYVPFSDRDLYGPVNELWG